MSRKLSRVLCAIFCLLVTARSMADVLQLYVQSVKNETIRLTLYSSNGKVVATKLFTLTNGYQKLNWLLPVMNPGGYFISTGKQAGETISVIKK